MLFCSLAIMALTHSRRQSKVRFFYKINWPTWLRIESWVELVSKEWNHLAAILHVYAGILIFIK